MRQVQGTDSGTFARAYETYSTDEAAEPVVEALYIYSPDDPSPNGMVPHSEWRAELLETGRTIIVSDMPRELPEAAQQGAELETGTSR